MRDPYAIPPKDRAVEGIEWLLLNHEVGDDGRLPPERELCEALGVSRTALRGAIAQLASQHVLESLQGSGTYACRRKPTTVFQLSGSFSDSVRGAGMTPGSRDIEARSLAAEGRTAHDLQVAVGSPVYKLTRVRTADERPVGIETAFVNAGLCPGIEAYDFGGRGLYDVLRTDYHVEPVNGYQRISITHVNRREADLLGVDEGTPAFFEKSFARTSAGDPVEFVRSIILPSRYRFASDEDADHERHVEVSNAWLMS